MPSVHVVDTKGLGFPSTVVAQSFFFYFITLLDLVVAGLYDRTPIR